mgnify:CR=1 FL=1
MTDGVDMALAKLDEQRKQGEAAQELGEKPKRKRGGQTIYTDEIAEEISRNWRRLGDDLQNHRIPTRIHSSRLGQG